MITVRKQRSVITPILILVIASLTLLPLISCVLSYFQFHSKRIEAMRMENAALIGQIDNWIESKGELAQNSALLLRNPEVSREAATSHFTSLLTGMDANGDVTEIYAGFPDDSAIFSTGYVPDPDWRATARPWYHAAVLTPGQTAYTMPYFDVAQKQIAFSVVHTVNVNNADAGVVAVDIPLTTLGEYIATANSTSESVSFLVNAEGDIMMHPNPDFAPISDTSFHNISKVEGGKHASMFESIVREGYYSNGGFLYIGTPLETTGWYVITDVPVSHVIADVLYTLRGMIITFALIVLIATPVLLVFIKKRVSMPLGVLSRFMTKASSTGDISLSQEDIENIEMSSHVNDEIGQCIGAAAGFVKHISDVSEALETIAIGDLSHDVELLSDKDIMGLALQHTIDNLNTMFSEINASTTQVSLGSDQIAVGAQTLAEGATEQAASIQELSSSISQIASKTKVNAETANRAADLADTIKSNAERGSMHMDEMVRAVGDISDASLQINKVIKVIDDIAFQTNILALNAAVEAARAGHHGRGFAVVAEEVRNLASRSAEAAKDTSLLLDDSMSKAQLGVQIAEETATSLTEIVSNITQSNQLVAEIAKSSEEQSLGIDQVYLGIDHVSQVVQQNSATAQESAAASDQMRGQSASLQRLIMQFKLKEHGYSHQALLELKNPA